MSTQKTDSTFEKLYNIDVSDKIEEKGKFKYLSWAYAWAELKKEYPEANYEVVCFPQNDGLPFCGNEKIGYMVQTKVMINNITHEMRLPIMDHTNRAKKAIDMMDVNKAIMRCLAKNIALFGLGLYIYCGEDVPNDDSSKGMFPELKDKLIQCNSEEYLKVIGTNIKDVKEKLKPEEIEELQSLYKKKQTTFVNAA